MSHSDAVSPTGTAARLLGGETVPIAGVLFDLDGTLIDSLPAVEASWQIWADAQRLPMPTRAMHGLTARDLVERMGVRPALRPESERLLESIEARPDQRILPMPGAIEMLTAIPPGRWGIVTSATRLVARRRISASGIAAPEIFITGDDVNAGKPDPEGFRRGIQALQRRPAVAPVLCLEDSTAGASAAYAAGGLTVAVSAGVASADGVAHLAVPSLEAIACATDANTGALTVRLR